jgi:DNA helicase HerA-like ATPase
VVAEDMKKVFAKTAQEAIVRQANDLLGSLVQTEQYVGEVFSLSYEKALVLIHDFHRQKVGGIPGLSFLIATRLSPGQDIDYSKEDSCIILLRVLDSAPLPNEMEAQRIRVETAEAVSGEIDKHWDHRDSMDPHTHHYLSFAGISCRVIGTFYLDQDPLREGNLILRFGGDMSNYYPNRGLKVYKPNGRALGTIVNYRDALRAGNETSRDVDIGVVRYASTNRAFQGISDVTVSMWPLDLLGQKTALFGMTRTGKSNTTKIMAKSVFGLRFQTGALRIGQLIFDPNGEYANENIMDSSEALNPNALKNVWKYSDAGDPDDVITYGLQPHPADPKRKLMLLNFLEESNLQIGKDIINASLEDETSKYLRNFVDVSLEKPDLPREDPEYHSVKTRFERRVLAYRTLLVKGGFQPPRNMQPSTSRLFNAKLLDRMRTSTNSSAPQYESAAQTLSTPKPTWRAMISALEILRDFINDPQSGYNQFEQEYLSSHKGDPRPWADEDFKKILEMFSYPNGARLLGRVVTQHTETTMQDYAVEICEALGDGKLVIVDQSSGDQILNKSSADRIMWAVFRRNQQAFRSGEIPPNILVYIEEAHTVLPTGSDENLLDIWVRAAKEGAKYNIGIVYATQEVSSIQKNILKNTSNWFIGHLNNTDETREISKYYDFADFDSSIRRAQDRGFLRMKTLSNPYVVPVQVDKFEVEV